MVAKQVRFEVDVDWDDSDYAGAGSRSYHYEAFRNRWGTNLGQGGEPLPLHAGGGVRVTNTEGIFDFGSAFPTVEQKMGMHRMRVRTMAAIPPSTETVTVWDGYGRMGNGGIQSGLPEVSLDAFSLMARVADIRYEQDVGNSTLADVLTGYATAAGLTLDPNREVAAVPMGAFTADNGALEFLQILAPMCNGFMYETHDGMIGVRSYAGALAATTRRVGSTQPILNIHEDDYLIYKDAQYGFPSRSIINRIDAHQLIKRTTTETARIGVPMVWNSRSPGLGFVGQWASNGRLSRPGYSRMRLTMNSLSVVNAQGSTAVYAPPGQTQEGVTSTAYPGQFNVLNPDGTALSGSDAGTDVIIRMPSTMDFSTFRPVGTVVVTADLSGPLPDGFNDTIHESYEPNASASPIARRSRTIFDQCLDTRPPWFRVGQTAHLQAEVNRLAAPHNIMNFKMPLDQETPDKSADVLDIRVGDVANIAFPSRGLASTKCLIAKAQMIHDCASVPRMEFVAYDLVSR